MEETRFSEFFSKLKLSANVITNLKNTNVDRVRVSVKRGLVDVSLLSDTFVNEECIEDFKSDLISNFPGISGAVVRVLYPMSQKSSEEKIEAFFSILAHRVFELSECCYPLFINSSWEVKGDLLIFTLENQSSASFRFKKIDEEIQRLIRERLGLNYKVVFRDSEPTQEYIQKNEQLIEQRVKREQEQSFSAEESKKTELPSNTIGLRSVPAARPAVEHESYSKYPRRQGSIKIGEIDEEPIAITEACSRGGEAVIEGKIFGDIELKEIKNDNVIVKFFVTDNKDSVMAKFFAKKEEYNDSLKGLIKAGKYLRLWGELSEDKFENNDLVLKVKQMFQAQPPKLKMDNASEKRVELHLHTNMSMMDGITSAETYIKRAAMWGHKAIAITDHGVAQAFPEAMNTADALKKDGKEIKILYGCEGYLVNDLGSAVENAHHQAVAEAEYIVFDLETTGLKKDINKIIEIGAVKLKGGKIIDRFSTFVNPEEPISEEITRLTSITDEDVKDAPVADEILPSFLSFVGDGVLVAHNAGFDVGFIRNWTTAHNIELNNTVIDTVEVGKTLLPDLKNYKLDTLCEALEVSLEHHHRAVDDAEATAGCFLRLADMLVENGAKYIDDINILASERIDKRKIKQYYHIIIFAKNLVGLKNLYRLISDAHLKYYLKKPKFPRSELIKNREGLIFGSACEAGELYTAVYENKPLSELKGIVDFYDYLEIQPLGNDFYMINNQAKSGKSVESVDRLIEINKKIVELGELYNKPVVATCDCHFIDPEDEVYRRIVQTGQGFKDVDNQAPLFFRTTEEMLGEFEYLGKDKAYEVVIKNTNMIADWMEEFLPVPRGTFPPHMENANEDFERICFERAHEIYGNPLPEIVEKRLRRELDSIIGNGYAVLYMIAQKLVWNSNENGYIVGSRGSVGSSFAATMAGITEVNPLQPHYVCPHCKYSDFESDDVKRLAEESMSGFDLPDKICPVCGKPLKKDGQAIPFETFLGFNGDKEPDIDLNFSGEYQTKAHKYCETLFGKGYVFKAGTISTLQEKTVYGYIKKYCEQHNDIYIKPSERKRLAMGCVGVKRSTGQHPGGLMVVPSDNDVLNFTPVQRPANDFESDVTTTHFDYHSISGRLLKLDMLGHDVPTILRMLYDITGFDPLNVPLDDKPTLSLFLKPDALGITEEDIHCPTGSLGLPEFGTHFVRQMLIDTQPTTFSELIRISGLSHGTDVWIGNAAELVHAGTATLKEVIATRDDIMGYLINHEIENFTAFTIMEKVRKGKGLAPEYEKLMREKNIPDWYIDDCKKVKYLFPKGHAVAYVTNSFRIGYFKINYPHAFYAATFSVKYEDFDYQLLCFGKERVEAKIKEVEALGKDNAPQKDTKSMPVFELVVEMYARGLKFAPIDLYESAATKFKVVEYEGEMRLLPPLCTLPGFGITVAEALINARAEGKFENIEEMQQRSGMGNKMVELLKENGVLNGMRESDQFSLFEL